MKDRGGLGQLKAYLLRHRERADLDPGGLEGPEMVVDFSAPDVAPQVRAVEAVAFCQKVLDRPSLTLERFTHRTVAGRKLRPRRAPVCPQTPVVDLVAR